MEWMAWLEGMEWMEGMEGMEGEGMFEWMIVRKSHRKSVAQLSCHCARLFEPDPRASMLRRQCVKRTATIHADNFTGNSASQTFTEWTSERMNEVKWNEKKMKRKWKEMKWNETKWNDMKWNWMIEWMNEWRNEWRNERTNERINESCKLYLPKVLWRCEFFFTVSTWNRALATVVCTFCRPHRPKELRTWQRLLCEIELSLQSRAHANLIFQKRSELDSFLRFFMSNRALATVLCTFCQQLLLIEACTHGDTNLLRRPRQPLYLKTHTVSRPRIFSGLNSHVPDMLHFPTTYIMMWLTSWCGCCPWQSSVTWKCSN
jgi:hypothetical protein